MADLIDRQAAIDALNEQIKYCDKAIGSFDISMKDEYAVKVERASLMAYAEKLEALPSAQPEIIHCRDCRWRKDQSGSTEWLPCRVIVTPSDFYCGRAGRRTDEGET